MGGAAAKESEGHNQLMDIIGCVLALVAALNGAISICYTRICAN